MLGVVACVLASEGHGIRERALSFLTGGELVALVVAVLEAPWGPSLWPSLTQTPSSLVPLAAATAVPELTRVLVVERDAVLHRAAAEGCWRAVARWAPTIAGYSDKRPLPTWVLHAAIARGDLGTVQRLHARVRYEPLAAAELAARHGRVAIVDWLLRHRPPPREPRTDARRFYEREGASLWPWFDRHETPFTWSVDLLLGLADNDDGDDDNGTVVCWRLRHLRTDGRLLLATPDGLLRLSLRDPAPDDELAPGARRFLTLDGEDRADGILDADGRRGLLRRLYQRPERRWVFVKFPRLLHLAVLDGDAEVANWALDEFLHGNGRVAVALGLAAQRGDVDVFENLLVKALRVEDAAVVEGIVVDWCLRIAVGAGAGGLVRHLLATRGATVAVTWSLVLEALRCDCAASVVRALAAACPGPRDDAELLCAAARRGHLEIVRWLVEGEQPTRHCPRAFAAAIAGNQVPTAAYLHQVVATARAEGSDCHHRGNSITSSIDMGIRRLDFGLGNVEAATWALNVLPGLPTNLTDAASLSALNALHRQYRHQQRQRLARRDDGRIELSGSTGAGSTAMQLRRWDGLLRTLVEHRPAECRWIRWLPSWAIWTDAVELFDRLMVMEHPSLLSIETLVAMLEWDVDRGTMGRWLTRASRLQEPPSSGPSTAGRALRLAARKGRTEVLAYLLRRLPALAVHRPGERDQILSAIFVAARYGQLAAVQVLRPHVVPWESHGPKLLHRAETMGHDSLVAWLRMLPAPSDSD